MDVVGDVGRCDVKLEDDTIEEAAAGVVDSVRLAEAEEVVVVLVAAAILLFFCLSGRTMLFRFEF